MTPFYHCRECGYRIHWPLDICQECGEDFDGDGLLEPTEGDATCVHCGGGEYDRCCPECRTPVDEEKWEVIEDRILADEKTKQPEGGKP